MPVLISKDLHSYSSLCQRCFVIVAATHVVLSNLYSLDLVGHHHRVLLTDLGGGFCLIIVGTVVLVRVPVDATEQVATTTVKAWKHIGQGSRLEQDRWLKKNADQSNMCCIRCSPLLTCKAHPFATQEALVFLRFGGVTLAFFAAGRSYRSRARSSRLVYNCIWKKKKEKKKGGGGVSPVMPRLIKFN